MLAEERRRRLLDNVNQAGALSVADAEKVLRVSRMTVHRDLDVLSDRGLIRKVHGGAVALAEGRKNVSLLARPFQERLPAAIGAKRAIAKNLLHLVAGARTFVLDASSTVFTFAEALPMRRGQEGLFVVTGGLPLFHALLQRTDGLRVALHGGEAHPRTGSLVGPLAAESLREMRFDWAVVSAVGLQVDEGVVYDATPEEAELKRLYLARARKKVLALDASKFNQSAPYKLAELSEFDALVSEKGIYAIRNKRPVRIKP